MKRISVIAMLVFSMNAMAQVTLGIGGFGFLTPSDTVAPGSSDTYNIWVRNTGSATFSDVLGVITAVRDTAATSLDTASITYSGSIVTLVPGDSILITLTNNYDVSPAGNFRYGIDVIVIWPVAANINVSDSLEYTVFIDISMNTTKLEIIDIIRAYPNPSAGKIIIGGINGLEADEVTIYDNYGRMLLNEKHCSTVDIEHLAAGIYRAQITIGKKHYSISLIKASK
ncbi:MAG TPA: T9SS type A sorting domain-containing protein [Bacteroidia bacterium]|jgi:hypothetical protein